MRPSGPKSFAPQDGKRSRSLLSMDPSLTEPQRAGSAAAPGQAARGHAQTLPKKPLFDLLPYQLRDYDLAVYAARLRVGGDVELASLEPDVPNLIGTRPVLVPGNVDVMGDGLFVIRTGPSVGCGGVVELNRS